MYESRHDSCRNSNWNGYLAIFILYVDVVQFYEYFSFRSVLNDLRETIDPRGSGHVREIVGGSVLLHTRRDLAVTYNGKMRDPFRNGVLRSETHDDAWIAGIVEGPKESKKTGSVGRVQSG